MNIEDFIDYELNRKIIIDSIETEFSLTRDELLILGLINKFNYIDEIYLSDLIFYINKYKLHYTRPMKRLAQKNFFKKKRHPQDERTVILYDIDYQKINLLFLTINKKHLSNLKKTKTSKN